MKGGKTKRSLLDNPWAMTALVLAYACLLYWPLNYLVFTYLEFAFFYEVPILYKNPFFVGGLLFTFATIWEVAQDAGKAPRSKTRMVTKYALLGLTIIRSITWGIYVIRM
jgi:hypothetical protein